jgi:hypothetical protein
MRQMEMLIQTLDDLDAAYSGNVGQQLVTWLRVYDVDVEIGGQLSAWSHVLPRISGRRPSRTAPPAALERDAANLLSEWESEYLGPSWSDDLRRRLAQAETYPVSLIEQKAIAYERQALDPGYEPANDLEQFKGALWKRRTHELLERLRADLAAEQSGLIETWASAEAEAIGGYLTTLSLDPTHGVAGTGEPRPGFSEA